jgi:hypothetical protein
LEDGAMKVGELEDQMKQEIMGLYGKNHNYGFNHKGP